MRIRYPTPQSNNHKTQMNPFMIALAIMQLLAAIHEYFYGSPHKCALYVCYTVANVILCIK